MELPPSDDNCFPCVIFKLKRKLIQRSSRSIVAIIILKYFCRYAVDIWFGKEEISRRIHN